MAASQALLADDILDSYPFARHKRLLDVGGGEGAFLSAVAARVSSIDLHLVDLPAVAARATERFERSGMSPRAKATGADIFLQPLPSGFDLISLVRIVHDHDDHRLLGLFRNVRQALQPGGAVIIAEPMSGIAGSAVATDVYFAFYLLAMGSGRPRSPAEIEALMRAAGFTSFSVRRTARPLIVSLLVAR